MNWNRIHHRGHFSNQNNTVCIGKDIMEVCLRIDDFMFYIKREIY